VTRPTGTWTDHLRRSWRTYLGRFTALDRLAHRAYFHYQRVLYAFRLTPDVLPYLLVESRFARGATSVRVRPLGGHKITLRPGTTDAEMLRDTFRDNVHPPPAEITPVRTIVDLGANAGVTVADNARRFPDARIVAVELDAGNAEAARRNSAPWADRVTILQGAVWHEDGEVPYAPEQGHEYGLRAGTGTGTAPAYSMDTILAHVDGRVDYMKMDIEGVEARLLSGDAARWLERVDSISLQVHDDYTLSDCARDLENAGFDARIDPRRKDYIVGVRRRGTAAA
jgi:FkbM family methyltransferase